MEKLEMDSKSILVVDDSTSVRKMLMTSLASQGFRLHEAEDGDRALEVLGREEVDMIISDLHMPGMNGAELAENVRGMSGYRFTPFIMLTSETDLGKKSLAREVGASAWLNKPFRPEQLLNVVRMVIG